MCAGDSPQCDENGGCTWMFQIKNLVVSHFGMLLLLTNNGEGLPDSDGGVKAGFPQVVGKLAAQHSHHAAAQVRKRWQHPILLRTDGDRNTSCHFICFAPALLSILHLQQTHLLYAESQYVIHVGRQQGKEGVEGPVVAEVSNDDGPQRSGRHYGLPGDVMGCGGQLVHAESGKEGMGWLGSKSW